MLDCVASDLRSFTKEDYLAAIAGSEGRVLACECIGITMPVLTDVTNAELAASLGADLLLLNMFDKRSAGSGAGGDRAGIKTPYRADDRHQSGAGGRTGGTGK